MASENDEHIDAGVETPDRVGAFPRLSEAQLEILAAQGERRPTRRDEVLFRAGDERYDFFAVLEGLVAVVDGDGDGERMIGVHGPGRFLGELSLLTGQPSFFTAIVREPGEVLAVPAERLRELVTHDIAFGDLLLRVFLLRRALLIELGAGLRIVGSRYSSDARRIRDFLARNRIPHAWIDLEDDPDAERLLRAFGVEPAETPIVVRGHAVLRNPTNAELAAILGLRPVRRDAVADLVVVGAGPAGLAASVYGSSEGLATVLLEAVATGGQASSSPRIENYLGFPAGVSGGELAERAALQAAKFGARIVVPADAISLADEDGYAVVTFGDERVAAQSVVLATGARYRKLRVPRLEEFEGVGVYYAATPMEARQCRAQPVVVVGGGNSAGQASLFLAAQSGRVTLLIRGGDLGKDMSRYLVDRIERDDRIEVLLHTEVRELLGEGRLERVVVESNESGERRTLPTGALFVFIGADPCTPWLAAAVALDDDGFVLTGADLGGAWAETRREPFLLETSRPGVFAAGDVRSGSIKRVASSVGEGSMAIQFVHRHLAGWQ